jgi:hypothetical protein
LVPLEGLKFLPRVGDKVYLPSKTGEAGSGLYKVVDISHSYDEDKESAGACPAVLGKIVARVEKL